MTGSDGSDAPADATPTGADTRRARIETAHGDPETARRLARALRPDNTAEMETAVEGSRLVTTIARDTTGSLQSTVDDYVVNLQTGARVATSEESTERSGASSREPDRSGEQDGNHNTDTHRDTSDTDTTDTDNP